MEDPRGCTKAVALEAPPLPDVMRARGELVERPFATALRDEIGLVRLQLLYLSLEIMQYSSALLIQI